MSAAIEALSMLLAGRLPQHGGLLESARLAGLGGEAFGQEAIVAAFVRARSDFCVDTDCLQSKGNLAAFDGTRAIVADLYAERLARLWWVGMPAVATTAPRPIAVPFDPDLAQLRGSVLFSHTDHPDLAMDHAIHVVAVVGAEVAALDARSRNTDSDVPQATPAFRRRAFVRRAFSVGERAAVLCAVAEWADDAFRRMTNRGLALSFRVNDSGPVLIASIADIGPFDTSWQPRA